MLFYCCCCCCYFVSFWCGCVVTLCGKIANFVAYIQPYIASLSHCHFQQNRSKAKQTPKSSFTLTAPWNKNIFQNNLYSNLFNTFVAITYAEHTHAHAHDKKKERERARDIHFAGTALSNDCTHLSAYNTHAPLAHVSHFMPILSFFFEGEKRNRK